MKIFYFDFLLSKKILKIFNKDHLKLFSDLSDILLIFYCLLILLFSIKNLVIILLGWITPNILQKLFNRERPYYFFKIEINYKTPPYRSFPSSHTFLSILIFLTMYKAKVNPILAILIFSIPILRIISLQHWFSDIVFSIALSTMLYSIFSALILGII